MVGLGSRKEEQKRWNKAVKHLLKEVDHLVSDQNTCADEKVQADGRGPRPTAHPRSAVVSHG